MKKKEDLEKAKTDKDVLVNSNGDLNDLNNLAKSFQNFLESRCLKCHRPGGVASFYDFSAGPEQLIDRGFLIAGDPINSKIYFRLNGVDLGGSREKYAHGDHQTKHFRSRYGPLLYSQLKERRPNH